MSSRNDMLKNLVRRIKAKGNFYFLENLYILKFFVLFLSDQMFLFVVSDIGLFDSSYFRVCLILESKIYPAIFRSWYATVFDL